MPCSPPSLLTAARPPSAIWTNAETDACGRVEHVAGPLAFELNHVRPRRILEEHAQQRRRESRGTFLKRADQFGPRLCGRWRR